MKHRFLIFIVVLFSLSCEDNATILFTYTPPQICEDSINDKRYYIVSDVNSLCKKGVLRRAYGLSREFVPSGKVDKQHFICREESEIDTLLISGHEPKVIGLFNRDSYKIEECDGCYRLIIEDNFWNFCHYLIVAYR